MIIERITLTAFRQHARPLGCEKTRRAVRVDPGGETDEIVAALKRTGLELQAVAPTHAHVDHVGGAAALKRARPCAEVLPHEADVPLYRARPRAPHQPIFDGTIFLRRWRGVGGK